jgi:hypothetical protein
MEEYKFSDSNLDFNELLDKYKKLNTTYSDDDDIRINIYENCNLLQDLTTPFPVPSTNIRLSSFKNNYIIADIQTLNLDRAFYDSNTTLFTTEETETYINNIDLTTIIKNYFDYTNDDIYPSKKIIIKINLHKQIVDTDGSGALQIDMKEIKEHFHSLFDTLELDIDQYVTGKHGTLEATNLQPSGTTGGKGQVAILNSAGPAINITNNDNPSSYFKLNIKTNGNVSGGFGASGGNGGNGKKNFGDWVNYEETSYNPSYSSTNYVEASYSYNAARSEYLLQLTFNFNGYTPLVKRLLNDDDSYFFPNYNKLQSVAGISENGYYSPSIQTNVYYDQLTYSIVSTGVQYAQYESYSGSSMSGSYKYRISAIFRRWSRDDEILPTPGHTGSKANYSNNADTQFPSRNGDTGTAHDGTGGAGGAKGNQGGITNITNIEEVANINII